MDQHDGITDFDAFVRDQRLRLRALVTTIARGRNDVDDLLQEGLARAYEKRATFVSEQHAVNFVCHVVRCLIVDEQRSWYRRNVTTAAEVAVVALDDPAEVVVATDECRRAVRSMVALPSDQRQLLWDHVVEGDSYADIARRTATPLATVRSTAHRARLAVLHRMRDAGDHVAGIPALVRAACWRWRPAPTNGESAAACAVAISLLFAGAAAAPRPPAAERVVTHEGVVTAAAVAAAAPVRRPAPVSKPVVRDAARPGTAEPSPTSAPAQLPDGTFKEVRFTGTYSRSCTFSPAADDPGIADRYDYDCTLTGHADYCVVVSQMATVSCDIVMLTTVDRGVMDRYADPLLGGPYCRPVRRDDGDIEASVGAIDVAVPAGSPRTHIPTQVVAKGVAATTSMIGSVDVNGEYRAVSAEVPFTCDAVLTDAIGFTGETRYSYFGADLLP